jgi:ribosomal protein L29
MKKKEISELLSKSESELKIQIVKLKEEMVKNVLEKFTARAKTQNIYGNNKKQIARILTLLRIKKGERS